MDDNDSELDLFSFLQPESEPEPEPAPEPEPEKPTPEDISPEPVTPPPAPKSGLTHSELQQLALGFLSSLNPDAVAIQVPARFRKYQVTAAGFWRGEGRGYRNVERTAVVVLYERFEHCFSDCADRDARLAAIHALREEKERLEEEIRRTEPELGSTDDLFSEFRQWDYASSRNPGYRKLRRKLEKLLHALHQGSRLEHIRRTGVADLCYLAVPEGLVAPDEIASGWGLVYLGQDRSFRLAREAEQQSIATPEGRQILAQNIAVAASQAVLFASGIDHSRSGRILYRRPPRRKARLRPAVPPDATAPAD